MSRLFPVTQNPKRQWESTGWVSMPQGGLWGLHMHYKRSSSLKVKKDKKKKKGENLI